MRTDANFFDMPDPGEKPPAPPGPPAKAKPTAVDFRNQFRQWTDQVARITAESGALTVADDDGNRVAVEMTGEIKRYVKDIERQRRKIVDPINAEVKKVNAFVKTFTGPLKSAERDLKNKIGRYAYQVEMDRRKRQAAADAAQRKAQEEMDRQAKAAKVEPVVMPKMVVPQRKEVVRTEKGTASTRYVWDFEVTNFGEVPHRYMMVDEKEIKKAINAGIRDIPGVRIFEKPVVTVRGI